MYTANLGSTSLVVAPTLSRRKTCPSELRAGLISRKRFLAASVKMITFESPYPFTHSGTLANRSQCLSILSSAGYPRAKDRRTVSTG
jgi:hypothetical protein